LAGVLEIGKTIISLDLLDKHFICDLKVCKGICCVYGDSGAPLENDEPEILASIYEDIKGLLRKEGIKTIENKGTHVIDSDGDIVTPLINDRECAYTIIEDGITRCGIEKAYYSGITDFIKPVSCHLFPVRITKYKKFDAVNYKPAEQCKCALILGEKEEVTVYEFLKDSLIRKYGIEWFQQLKAAGDSYNGDGKFIK